MALSNKVEETAGQKALAGFAKLLAIIIIMAVAGFGDVMYVLEMSHVFAGQGLLIIFSYLGAIMGFAACGYLLIGKLSAFRPGAQMLASWIVFAMEMIIVALNIIYVFTVDKTGPLAAWGFISPATPVLHMFGVSIVLLLDPGQKSKHRTMELQQKIKDKNEEFEYYKTVAQLDVKTAALAHLKIRLTEKQNSEAVINTVDEFADDITAQVLGEMTGKLLDKPKDGRDGGFGRYRK